MLAIVSIEKCQFQHSTEICEERICRDKSCKFRHPKSCKYGEKCHFLQRNCCFYNHKVSKQNKIKETEKLEKQVKKLELDVATLSKVLEDKENKLQ